MARRLGGFWLLIANYRLPTLLECYSAIIDERQKMTRPIPDKAEIALEYPDKLYLGTFEHSSRFEAHLDPTGFALILERPGAEDVRKSIHMHINFGLFASILGELASTVSGIPKDDILHRDQLTQAVAELHRALIQA
jgi:hypothetical protein